MKTYNLLRLSFTRLQSTFALFIEFMILLFYILPSFYRFSLRLNHWIFGWDETHEIGIGVTFLFLTSAFSAVLKMPFELYRLSVIDSKFVESAVETTRAIAGWVIDQAKVFLLTTFIGIPLLSLILKLLSMGSAFHWSYLWMGSIAVSVVISELYPNYLLPLFYKIEPFPESDIRTKIEGTIARLGFPVKDIVLIENFSSGGGNVVVTGSATGQATNLRISIYQNVLETLNEDDLLAILVHELNHFICKDNMKDLAMQIISMAIFLLSLSRCIYDKEFYKSFGFENVTNPGIGLLLFSYYYQAIGSAISVITNIVHRQFEYNCDIFAEENGYSIDEALIKMHVDNVFSLIVDKHYSRYYNSHPSLLERIENIKLYRERKKKTLVFSSSLGDLIDLEERKLRKQQEEQGESMTGENKAKLE